MKLLIDNALSPSVADRLRRAGHDVLHVRDVGKSRATDAEIIELALEQGRVIVSADTDFGTLLTLHELTQPSFILLRGDIERKPDAQASVLIRELPDLENDLMRGAIVVITRDRIRVRRLSQSSD